MKKLIFLFAIFSSVSASAGTSLFEKTITNIVTYDDYALIQFTPSDTATNCTKTDYVHIDLSNGKGKAIYASALTAATAKKEVRLKVNEGDCDNVWQAANLYQIDVNFID